MPDDFSAEVVEVAAGVAEDSPVYVGGGLRDLPSVLLKKLRPADLPYLAPSVPSSGLVGPPGELPTADVVGPELFCLSRVRKLPRLVFGFRSERGAASVD